MLVLVIGVMGQAVVEGSVELEVPAFGDMDFGDRRNDEQLGVALVALGVEELEVEVGTHVILVLIAFPREEAVVLHVKRERTELLERQTGVRLPSEATADIVVAVDEVIVVALAAAKDYAIEEEALLQERHAARCRELDDESRSECSRLANLERVLHVGALDAVGSVIVEVLVNTPLHSEVLLVVEVVSVEPSYEVYIAQERLGAYVEAEVGREIVVWLCRLIGKGVAVLHVEAKPQVMATTGHMALVGNITLADDNRCVDRYAVVVVVEVVAAAHAPGIAAEDAVEGTDRIEHAGGKLMPEPGPATLTVVESQCRCAVKDLANGYSSEGG